MVAHRLSTVQNADEIVVMQAGAIVERGSHQEILAKQGKYAEMWSQQAKRDELVHAAE
ncbi:MAG: putative multidrug resistance ABC transporter ATP-binding/permease protein YheH [Hyphomonas sp. TMED17]|nr:MAG: putative multidrug resistance ABC transporter ATP-binding/permease protein YheH [Hyphomonas sp. TMED17]